MLNRIILALIQKSPANVLAMQVDAFENPATYKSWIYPIRYLLALRYLKYKQIVLQSFRHKLIYPVPENDFKVELIQSLLGKRLSIKEGAGASKTAKISQPTIAFGFKSYLIYPLLMGASIIGFYQLNDWYQQRKIENVLANYLPYYSDLIHQKLLFERNGIIAPLKGLGEKVASVQEKILNDLPERDGIRSAMQEQLENLKDADKSSADIMFGFKAVNTLFDKQGMDYYLSPKSFSPPCSSLIEAPVEEMMMLKKLEQLMSNNDPERCRTTMMTVYKVDDRTQLYYDEDATLSLPKSEQLEQPKTVVELPLFRVRRIDKVPAVDSALGLTYKEHGIGSIILLDRIKSFSEESVLPALTFQGRNYVIPYWMQGYYEIEEAVTKGYQKDIKAIYPDKVERRKVKVAIKQLIKDKSRMQNSKMERTLERTNSNSAKSIFGNGFDAISVMLGKKKADQKNKAEPTTFAEEALLKKLDDVLLPSIEYHEAYHQIDKKQWKSVAWMNKLKDELSDDGMDHMLEELGAYLAQLANTKQGHNIWLSKLLIFSLNPMTKGQAEYYASSIILTTMESLYLSDKVEPYYEAEVDDKTNIYRILTIMDNQQIRDLSRRAYEVLFERKVPNLLAAP